MMSEKLTYFGLPLSTCDLLPPPHPLMWISKLQQSMKVYFRLSRWSCSFTVLWVGFCEISHPLDLARVTVLQAGYFVTTVSSKWLIRSSLPHSADWSWCLRQGLYECCYVPELTMSFGQPQLRPHLGGPSLQLCDFLYGWLSIVLDGLAQGP